MGLTGTIFDSKKYAIHDGPGIRTTVFLKGCPLNCCWCHNPEGRSPEPETRPMTHRAGSRSSSSGIGRTTIGCTVTVDQVMAEILKDEIFYDQSGGGATFSGGEPMMQTDFLAALLEGCRQRGIRTAVDTCGYAPEGDFDRVYDLVDLFLFDLKLMDEARHVEYTGVSNDLILGNLTHLASRGRKVVVRIPMIPDITDTPQNLEAVAAFLRPLPNVRHISLLPYNKLGEDKAQRYNLGSRRLHSETQSADDMRRRADWLESHAYKVKIGG